MFFEHFDCRLEFLFGQLYRRACGSPTRLQSTLSFSAATTQSSEIVAITQASSPCIGF